MKEPILQTSSFLSGAKAYFIGISAFVLIGLVVIAPAHYFSIAEISSNEVREIAAANNWVHNFGRLLALAGWRSDGYPDFVSADISLYRLAIVFEFSMISLSLIFLAIYLYTGRRISRNPFLANLVDESVKGMIGKASIRPPSSIGKLCFILIIVAITHLVCFVLFGFSLIAAVLFTVCVEWVFYYLWKSKHKVIEADLAPNLDAHLRFEVCIGLRAVSSMLVVYAIAFLTGTTSATALGDDLVTVIQWYPKLVVVPFLLTIVAIEFHWLSLQTLVDDANRQTGAMDVATFRSGPTV